MPRVRQPARLLSANERCQFPCRRADCSGDIGRIGGIDECVLSLVIVGVRFRFRRIRARANEKVLRNEARCMAMFLKRRVITTLFGGIFLTGAEDLRTG